ncbi:Sco2 protein precursor [Rickettsia akari str. Hartford]|uniref:Sco2 protein n=2 Tax=Rickettsia akari TaxID=786 RepID=A8GLU4_RICAH|nr:Sco2 protein precursor [Rickettsia akari str. Hartford]
MYIIKIFIALSMITCILFLCLFYSSLTPSKFQIGAKTSNIDDSPKIKFTLIDQVGKKFDSTHLHGHLSFIYFGTTYSLHDNQALKRVEDIIKILKQESISVQVVFITLDPEHDTSEVLKKYLEKIDGNFIGLTGKVADIKQLADQFKVFYASKILDVETNEYELQHSNFVYLISSHGKFLKHYCLGLPKNG